MPKSVTWLTEQPTGHLGQRIQSEGAHMCTRVYEPGGLGGNIIITLKTETEESGRSMICLGWSGRG